MAAAAKVACEEAKEVKKKERNDKTARLAAARINKKHHREAENTQKALQLSQRGKRTVSQMAAPKAKRARCTVEVQDSAEVGKTSAAAPPKLTTHGRKIKKPCKFE
jgi:predicted ATP-dependent protease